jgi:hypothetical protein
MLLSFERPRRESPAATLLAVLENCRCEADARAIDKQLVRQQTTHPPPGVCVTGITVSERESVLHTITVKIVRAHGGCLGT